MHRVFFNETLHERENLAELSQNVIGIISNQTGHEAIKLLLHKYIMIV